MILIDDIKYSCMECIRGHRSSSCQHHTRPLLQVRSKGRPNVHANGNPNHRIAVFAEEIAGDTTEKNGPNRSKCRRGPVIILKSSPKQVIDLISGQIVGPYDDRMDSTDPNSRPPPPIIHSDSFINTSTCCTTNGVTKKASKSCGCCSNKSKKTFNKSSILKKYLSKHLQNKKTSTNKQSAPPKTLENATFMPEMSTTKPESSTEPAQSKIFNVVSVPSCSIPGSCACDDDCTCDGCVIHGNSSINDLSKLIPNLYPMDNDVNTLESNLVFNSVSAYPSRPPQIQLVSQSAPYHEPSEQKLQPFDATTFFTDIVGEQNENVSSSTETDSPNSGTCTCPDDSCDCTNCESHGIINGYKLDDFFNSHIDSRLFLALQDIPKEKELKLDEKIERSCCSKTTL